MNKWLLRLIAGIASVLASVLLAAMLMYLYLSNKTNGELVSSGETRKYLLHVPQGYDATTAAPLVISLHGAYLWPNSQLRFSMWNELADREGFIVVYPKAAGFPAVWRMAPGDDLDIETRFFNDLIDDLSRQYHIDPARIYLNGFSNGAAMTIMLACTMPDRIAAFGMVATPTVPWDWCADPRPAPVIVFNGTLDPFVPYEGGENFLTTEPLLSMPAWISRWGERNRCSTGPTETAVNNSVTTIQYSDCAQETSAVLYTIEGAGHIWPGGMQFPGNFAGPYSDSIDATEEMWGFFQRHAKQTPKQVAESNQE